jgi:3-oxoacyl-[acyl-carrier-protein] synthase-3
MNLKDSFLKIIKNSLRTNNLQTLSETLPNYTYYPLAKDELYLVCFGYHKIKNFIQSNTLKQIIIVAGDTYRSNINVDDRSTFLLFSDAVSATLLESRESSQILGFDFGGDGINFEDISLAKYSSQDSSSLNFYMNGAKVFQFTQKSIPDSINRVLTRTTTKIDELTLVIFHQASGIVLNTLNEKIALNKSQTYETISKFGNTGSASIPITLSEYLKFSSLKPGDLVLLSGFGIGLSFGSVLLKW